MIDKAAARKKIANLQILFDNQGTAYDYEKACDQTWSQIGRVVFQESLEEVSIDRNKKRDKHELWGSFSEQKPSFFAALLIRFK